jgi:hypothetical protein
VPLDAAWSLEFPTGGLRAGANPPLSRPRFEGIKSLNDTFCWWIGAVHVTRDVCDAFFALLNKLNKTAV